MQQVNNTITKSDNRIFEYDCGGKKIKLSNKIVRDFLVSGGGNVSDQEIMMFISLCKYQGLNPFIREAYLIKYGSSPATIVTGKDAFIKKANRNPAFKGFEAGVIVQCDNINGLEYRKGQLVLEGEKLVGGYAKVFINGYDVPLETSVSFNEYVGRKSNGEINSQWSGKPATMIRKVALVQALREAFPEDMNGLYSEEEMPVNGDLPTNEVVVENENNTVYAQDFVDADGVYSDVNPPVDYDPLA